MTSGPNTVAPAAQLTLADLADVDRSVLRLRRSRADLDDPGLARADEDAIAAAREDVARARIRLEDLDRDVTRLAGDVETLRRRQAHDRTALAERTVTGRARTELEHDQRTLDRRIAELGDELTAARERREAVAADAERSAALVDDRTRVRDEAAAARRAQADDVDAAIARAGAEREEIARRLDPELLGLYDALAAELGQAVGRYVGGSCTACGLYLDASARQRVAAAPDDALLRCPECGVILVRSTATA